MPAKLLQFADAAPRNARHRTADRAAARSAGGEVFDRYLRELDLCREAVSGASLDSVVGEYLVRWIITHMIEEYARHNGHADLLRERIDGARGV